jgi:hypothetical protein
MFVKDKRPSLLLCSVNYRTEKFHGFGQQEEDASEVEESQIRSHCLPGLSLTKTFFSG